MGPLFSGRAALSVVSNFEWWPIKQLDGGVLCCAVPESSLVMVESSLSFDRVVGLFLALDAWCIRATKGVAKEFTAYQYGGWDFGM